MISVSLFIVRNSSDVSVESKFNERYSLYELTHGPTYLVFKHQPSPKKTSLEAKLPIIQNQDSLSIALAIFFHFVEISSQRTAGANMYSLHRPLSCQAVRANILQRSKILHTVSGFAHLYVRFIQELQTFAAEYGPFKLMPGGTNFPFRNARIKCVSE